MTSSFHFWSAFPSVSQLQPQQQLITVKKQSVCVKKKPPNQFEVSCKINKSPLTKISAFVLDMLIQ